MSNVPMTRPEEALAIHEPAVAALSTFVELQDGRILAAAGDTSAFTVSSGSIIKSITNRKAVEDCWITGESIEIYNTV